MHFVITFIWCHCWVSMVFADGMVYIFQPYIYIYIYIYTNLNTKRTFHIYAKDKHRALHTLNIMMTSSNGKDFRVTGLLCREFIGHRWIHGMWSTPPIKSLWTVLPAADSTLTLRLFQQVAVRKPLYVNQPNMFCFKVHISCIVNGRKW